MCIWPRLGGFLAALLCVLISPLSLDAGGLQPLLKRAAFSCSNMRSPHAPRVMRAKSALRGLRLRGGGGEENEDLFEDDEEMQKVEAMEEDKKLSDQEYGMMQKADYVIRPKHELNMSFAFAHAEHMKKESAVVFMTAGKHNMSFEGEIIPPCEVHMMAQEGGYIAGYAEPIKLKGMQLPHPESGGGRFRLTKAGTGSTFTKVVWENRNIHCVIACEGTCALFQDCTLRCEAFHYVSAVWAYEGSFLAFKGCTIGGFSKTQQATNGIVVEGSTSLLDGCRVEYIWGACVLVAMNSSVRVQNSILFDSHSALAACDGKLHDGDEFFVDGSVELVNNTIKCVEPWRDPDRTKVYVDLNNTWLQQDFPELAWVLKMGQMPKSKLVWDADKQLYIECGNTDWDQRKEQRFFDAHRRKGEANVPKIQKEIRRMHKKPWESSSSSEDDLTEEDEYGNPTKPANMTLAQWEARKPRKEVNPMDFQMPRNRHFHGVHKAPRILKNRKLRNNEYKLGRKQPNAPTQPGPGTQMVMSR